MGKTGNVNSHSRWTPLLKYVVNIIMSLRTVMNCMQEVTFLCTRWTQCWKVWRVDAGIITVFRTTWVSQNRACQNVNVDTVTVQDFRSPAYGGYASLNFEDGARPSFLIRLQETYIACNAQCRFHALVFDWLTAEKERPGFEEELNYTKSYISTNAIHTCFRVFRLSLNTVQLSVSLYWSDFRQREHNYRVCYTPLFDSIDSFAILCRNSIHVSTSRFRNSITSRNGARYTGSCITARIR